MQTLTVHDYALLSVIGPQRERFLRRTEEERKAKIDSLSPFGKQVAERLITTDVSSYEDYTKTDDVSLAAEQVMRLNRMWREMRA